MAEVFLLEDDIALNAGIKIALEMDKHNITSFYSLSDAQKSYPQNRFDILLLDIHLPDGSGLAFCREIREKNDLTPVIFITANDTENDMLSGFKAGCDDYISKPFSIAVLRQKVLAVLKRTVLHGEPTFFEYRDLKIDYDKMQVTRCGEDCRLTSTEYKLVEYMAKNRGRVLTRSTLLEQIWDIDGNFIDENTLSVHIKRIRNKVEKDIKNPVYIKTVFGIGYTFGE